MKLGLDLADNNYLLEINMNMIDMNMTHIITWLLFPDICPTILSPITILIIRNFHSSWGSPSRVILLGGE